MNKKIQNKKEKEWNLGGWVNSSVKKKLAKEKEPTPTYKEGYVSKFIYNERNEFVEEVHVKV